MTAHPLADLPAYANGTLALPETARLRAHLDNCADCRAELAGWRAISTAAQVWRETTLATTSAIPESPRGSAFPAQTPNSYPALTADISSTTRQHGGRIISAALAASAIAALLLAIIYRAGDYEHEQILRSATAIPTLSAAGSSAPASATPKEFVATHRSLPDFRVNLRPSPTIDNEPIAVLDAGTYLQHLNEQHEDREGNLWLRFRTEEGDIGWLREGTFEEVPVGTSLEPTPTVLTSPRKQTVPTDCTVAPRPGGGPEIERLFGQSPGEPPILPNRPTMDEATSLLDANPAANTEHRTGILRVATLLVACQADAFTYDPDHPTGFDLTSPFFNLFSDDAFRRGGPSWSNLYLPSGAGSLTVERAVTLADGRILALLHDSDWTAWGYRLIVFKRLGERWLIDEVENVIAGGPASQLPEYVPPQILQAIMLEDGVFLRMIPSQPAFCSGRDVQIVVTNLDAQTRRLNVDAFHIEIALAAGDRTVATIPVPTAGDYRITTDTGIVSGLGVPFPPDHLRIVDYNPPNAVC